MRTLEQRAQDFTSSGEYTPTLKECYIAGASEEHLLLTHWNSIDEDKDGFATEDVYDRIVYRLPVLVKEVATGEVYAINQTDIGDWSEELYYHARRYKWRQIHE